MANRYQMWIVPDGQLQASLSKTTNVPGLPGLNGMFSVRLKQNPNANPTHNACAGWMSEAEVNYLMANLSQSFMVYEPAAGEEPEHPLVTIQRLGYSMSSEV